MKKILDLSVFEAVTLDVNLPDNGGMIKLLKPSQKLTIKMMALKNLDIHDSEAILRALDDMVLDILNSNDEGKIFDRLYINKLNTTMKATLVEAYSEFIAQVQSDPNS